jgi:hypothetical protein
MGSWIWVLQCLFQDNNPECILYYKMQSRFIKTRKAKQHLLCFFCILHLICLLYSLLVPGLHNCISCYCKIQCWDQDSIFQVVHCRFYHSVSWLKRLCVLTRLNFTSHWQVSCLHYGLTIIIQFCRSIMWCGTHLRHTMHVLCRTGLQCSGTWKAEISVIRLLLIQSVAHLILTDSSGGWVLGLGLALLPSPPLIGPEWFNTPPQDACRDLSAR